MAGNIIKTDLFPFLYPIFTINGISHSIIQINLCAMMLTKHN